MSYELTNASCWEYVLIDEKRPEARDPMADLEAASATSTGGTSMLAADGKPLAPEDNIFDDREVLDAPVSWSAPITIDRDTFLARYPGNYKKVPFKKSVLEKFSEYQDGKAGLIEKISIYEAEEFKNGDEVEIRETFAHRKYDISHR